ncbi:MAG: hypothetical protein ACHP7O_05665 [Burkholderiales bacterium]
MSEAWKIIKAIQLLFINQTLGSATLTGGASATVTTGSAFTAVVNGTLVAKASGVNLAALNGPTVTLAVPFQVWLLTIDALGNFYTYPGVPATTLAAVGIPAINQSNGPQAPVGFITMNNTSVGSFIPATTLLNVANLGITYNNIGGPFFPVVPT